MKNSNRPVYPILDLNQDLSGLHGLTKREYFAAHAPEVPEWWLWPDKERIDAIGECPEYPREHLNSQFDTDPPIDLEKQEEIKQKAAAYVNYKNLEEMLRLRAWRYYYADMMLAEEPAEGGGK